MQTERQLRAALKNPSLGWSDRRVVQLTGDLLLSATITISSPVRIEGYCTSNDDDRCTIRAANSQPLFHITGPAALVRLGNLQLVEGRGLAGMGGAVTASNHSQVEITSCELTMNTAASGGAILISDHSHVNLISSDVTGNSAVGCGGGVSVLSGSLHMDKSTVEGNTGAEGGGICMGSSSLLTAINSTVTDNRLRGKAARNGSNSEAINTVPAAALAGRDIEMRSDWSSVQGSAAEAYFDPVPVPQKTIVAGGRLQTISELRSHLPGAPAPFPVVLPRAEDNVGAARAAGIVRGARSQVKSSSLGRDDVLARRGLRQSTDFPPGAQVVDANSEQDLAQAFINKERYISLQSHIVMTGDYTGPNALLPSIKASVTIEGTCPDPYGGKCLMNAQGLGAILYADNSAYLAGVEMVFKNIIFLNGQNSGNQGGAFANTGALSVTFINCDFVNNAAGAGGAVALVEGAFSVFQDCNFKNNAAATDGSGTGIGGAVLLTGASGFTRCDFNGNTALNGGAVGVGGSSNGIFWDECTFEVSMQRPLHFVP